MFKTLPEINMERPELIESSSPQNHSNAQYSSPPSTPSPAGGGGGGGGQPMIHVRHNKQTVPNAPSLTHVRFIV